MKGEAQVFRSLDDDGMNVVLKSVGLSTRRSEPRKGQRPESRYCSYYVKVRFGPDIHNSPYGITNQSLVAELAKMRLIFNLALFSRVYVEY